jgi:hypothetical protein
VAVAAIGDDRSPTQLAAESQTITCGPHRERQSSTSITSNVSASSSAIQRRMSNTPA